MRVCFHIHTKYSFDSFMNPKKILKIYSKMGINRVYITDHNTMKGALIAKKLAKEMNLDIDVVLGTEIKTEYGDIIATHIMEDIKTYNFLEVIDYIKDQSGIAILPHPYRAHRKVEWIASLVDAIEIWNGHCNKWCNEKAKILADKYKKPPVVGSDAHFYEELDSAIMEFTNILDKKKKFYVKYPNKKYKEMSNLIGHIKRGRFWRVPYTIWRIWRVI